MKIAFFGRAFDPSFTDSFKLLIRILEERATSFHVYENFYAHIHQLLSFNKPVEVWANGRNPDKDTFCMISVGGDGTLLDTITLLHNTGVPVLGVNTGRLGFLSATSTEEISHAANALITGDYSIDRRAMMQLVTPPELFGNVNYALNELTVLKRDTSSMINISAFVDDQFLNTYWADGLIVATPTGSTGYSLSCGGPIISPESKTFVITPIATHNLTVRPIIIPDSCTIKLRIAGRTQDFLVALDSRSTPINTTVELIVKRANSSINLICIGQKDFYQTIRNKLAWGFDKRN